MLTRPLGATDLQVSILGFGGAPLGNMYKPVSDKEARDTLAAALDSGLNFFDTAPHYGAGLSERRIGDAVRGAHAKNCVVSTKVGRLLYPDSNADVEALRHGFVTPMPFEQRYDYSYDGIMRSWEDSLIRLGLAIVDVLLVHDIGIETHREFHKDRWMEFTAGGGYRALEELRAGGQVRAIGLGVNEIKVCEAALDVGQFDCFLLAGRYTLLEQNGCLELFSRCLATNTSIIAGGPFNSGILATGVTDLQNGNYNYVPATAEIIERVSAIEAICREFDISLAAAALQLPLAHSAVASVIPGLASVASVNQALNWIETKSPAQFWNVLKEHNLLAADVPIPLFENLHGDC